MKGISAFVIRPFGVKNGIDFENTARKLIDPALEKLGLIGTTTVEIVRQGNIRTDMFERLLTADFVIADLSIHNANVYYELGIRHALRQKRTFLLRARVDEIPFDLKTDRYFVYDHEAPGDSLDTLVHAIRSTLSSSRADSPVFQLLPELKEQGADRFIALPDAFYAETQGAVRDADLAHLALLSEEVQKFRWARSAWRILGQAQFEFGDWDHARVTWQRLLRLDPSQFEANVRLGTIYQKLGDLTRSDQALQAALARIDLEPNAEAEARALLGSNDKARWRAEWDGLNPDDLGSQALLSPFLQRSLRHYADAFIADRNHYYSGVNELALRAVRSALARRLPDDWSCQFESEEAAELELKKNGRKIDDLIGAVRSSFVSARTRAKRAGRSDEWVANSEALVELLVSKRPRWVAQKFRTALIGKSRQAWATEQAQLSVFEDLGIFEENVSEVLSVLADEMPEGCEEVVKKTRVILFTGHMIDAEDRPKARFPKTSESAAKDLIRGALEELVIGDDEELIGIAGAACGGDILFLEVCEEMGISVSIHLALDRENFVKASVAEAGASWIDRFDRLCARHPTKVLKEGREAPAWNPKASNWERANLWMLNAALAYGGSNVTLLALWDGTAGDGPGGTAHMVEAVEDRAGRVIILDAGQLVPIASGTTGVMAAIDPQTRTPRAFVIYSSMDGDFVDRELRPFLSGCGMRVSCDQVLKVSDAAAEGLSQLIKSSDLVFVVISKHAVGSKKVKDHTDLAIRNDKDLVLACLDESEPGRIHARLRFAFAVDLQDERERDDLAERIAKIR